MEILWPWALLLLWLLPALVAFYVWMLRRRRRFAVRYSSLALVREALVPQARWRRHLPFVLFLLALIGLVLALARPAAVVQVPTNETAILLTIDVSRSMCSTDIPPTRLAAASAAALSFIERQPAGTRIGIVAFAGFAQLLQPPTTDRALLEATISSLTTGRRTAIGSGILAALDAIAELNPDVAPIAGELPPGPLPEPAATYVPQIIVLLTDGASTTGTPPLDAARQAASEGVRIYTIGFGTENGGELICEGQFFGGGFGGGGFGGFRRGIDEATLVNVAELTGGEYYSATSAGELHEVFNNLPISYSTRAELMELSVIFVGIGALLAALAIGLSLLWNRLP